MQKTFIGFSTCCELLPITIELDRTLERNLLGVHFLQFWTESGIPDRETEWSLTQLIVMCTWAGQFTQSVSQRPELWTGPGESLGKSETKR